MSSSITGASVVHAPYPPSLDNSCCDVHMAFKPGNTATGQEAVGPTAANAYKDSPGGFQAVCAPVPSENAAATVWTDALALATDTQTQLILPFRLGSHC